MANAENACKLPDSPLEPPKSMLFKALPKEEGGYPCEFVDPPPSLLPSECAICLQIYREPHLIGCCGHNFCRTCITPVQKQGRPCPLCGELSFTILRNKGLERSLNELRVVCAHQKSGCEWKGELAMFERHLNENPDTEKQLEGCEYAMVECIHGCGGLYMRCQINKHQTDLCPQRPYLCDYCRDYTSVHADVVYRHWPVCKCYPLSCPHQCTVYAIERQNLEHHLNIECPLRVIDCDFHYVGCEVQLRRKDMPDHLATNHIQHTSLLAAMSQKLMEESLDKDEQISKLNNELETRVAEVQEESRREISELKRENNTLKLEITNLKDELTTLKESLSKEISQVRVIEAQQETVSKKGDESLENQIAELRKQLELNQIAIRRQCHSVQAYVGHFPVEFTMHDFERHTMMNDDWQSLSFHTHLEGYKMCIIVNANGYSTAKEMHVSVYACLMHGEFDDQLQWPFRAEITIQLLNQLGDRNHATGTIRFTERTPEMYTSKVTGAAMRAEKGWGLQQFIGHVELGYNEVKNRQYLKNDCLQFRIARVKLLIH